MTDNVEYKCLPHVTSNTVNTVATYTGWNTVKGWECPRCAKINAPFMSSCTCRPGYALECGPVWTMPVTYTTSASDTVKGEMLCNHPVVDGTFPLETETVH